MNSNPELEEKIIQIESDIKDLIKSYCHENYSVTWYGAYYIDPKHLVYWISVQSDAMKKKLQRDAELNRSLREILSDNNYPLDARNEVYIGFESQQTVNRESNGNWYHHFK